MGIVKAQNHTGDTYGRGREANKNSSISAVNRFRGDRTWLVLRKDNADLLVIPDTAQGIVPKLENAYIKDNQLAVVIDYEFSFLYELYSLEGGAWKKSRRCDFVAWID